MKKPDIKYDSLFGSHNRATEFYLKYQGDIKDHAKNEWFSLPIAAAYNAGFNEGYMKARNELCHISQTKND